MTAFDDRTAPTPLEGTSWQALSPSATRSTIAFAEGRAFVSGGVNRFTGSATVEAARLTFGPLAVTRMAGPPEAMADEDAFLAALAAATSWTLEDARLVLRDESGEVRLVLEPDPDRGPA